MMPKTMKAAVLHEFGKPLKIEEVPVKTPGSHQVLVKVIVCGVCHTDLHACEGDWPVKPNYPRSRDMRVLAVLLHWVMKWTM